VTPSPPREAAAADGLGACSGSDAEPLEVGRWSKRKRQVIFFDVRQRPIAAIHSSVFRCPK
jgi:hypothetical protein